MKSAMAGLTLLLAAATGAAAQAPLHLEDAA